MAGVRHIVVTEEEEGIRLDRWFRRHYPHYSHIQLQKLLRTGQIRLDGGRVKASARLKVGQNLRLPPMEETPPSQPFVVPQRDRDFMRSLVLYEDDNLLALNKPSGLAVQGGSKTHRHIDGLLPALSTPDRPFRLTHRLDKETSGLLLIAKTPGAAARLAGDFQHHRIRKTYWAITSGLPHPQEGIIKGFIRKGVVGGEERMMEAQHGQTGAQYAKTNYKTLVRAGHHAAWLALYPETGRTHQLRLHLKLLGTPILGDKKYGEKAELPKGFQHRLHLHARELEIPGEHGPPLRLTAPLPLHIQQAFDILGFDERSG